jgi:hypothetical protein
VLVPFSGQWKTACIYLGQERIEMGEPLLLQPNPFISIDLHPFLAATSPCLLGWGWLITLHLQENALEHPKKNKIEKETSRRWP